MYKIFINFQSKLQFVNHDDAYTTSPLFWNYLQNRTSAVNESGFAGRMPFHHTHADNSVSTL